MIRYLSAMLAVALLVLVSSGNLVAETKAIDDIYISQSDPGDAYLTDAPWQPYDGGSIEVLDGASIWIGIENRYLENLEKILHLTIIASDTLEFASVVGYADMSGTTTSSSYRGSVSSSDTTLYSFFFDPQPLWEVVELTPKAGESVTIAENGIMARSLCRGVPTLTHWGLLVLVVLLVASAVYVIYRRRKTVTA